MRIVVLPGGFFFSCANPTPSGDGRVALQFICGHGVNPKSGKNDDVEDRTN